MRVNFLNEQTRIKYELKIAEALRLYHERTARELQNRGKIKESEMHIALLESLVRTIKDKYSIDQGSGRLFKFGIALER